MGFFAFLYNFSFWTGSYYVAQVALKKITPWFSCLSLQVWCATTWLLKNVLFFLNADIVCVIAKCRPITQSLMSSSINSGGKIQNSTHQTENSYSAKTSPKHKNQLTKSDWDIMREWDRRPAIFPCFFPAGFISGWPHAQLHTRWWWNCAWTFSNFFSTKA